MFVLDKKLTDKTIYVGSLTLCQVLLMNQHRYPWLILVPAINDVIEIFDLSLSERIMLMSEINHVSAQMKLLYGADTINIALETNEIPQLHIDIVARKHNDPSWPAPVWQDDVESYNEARIALEAESITQNIISSYPRGY